MLKDVLWTDKYQPKQFGEIQVNSKVTEAFEKISRAPKELPHMLLYGPPGSGKKTQLMACLRKVFGSDIDDKVISRVEITSGTFGSKSAKAAVKRRKLADPSSDSSSLLTISSPHHVECNPSLAGGVLDTMIIQKIVVDMAESNTISVANRSVRLKVKPSTTTTTTTSSSSSSSAIVAEPKLKYRVLIINCYDKLTKKAQEALRRTIEKYGDRCRLVLMCNSSTKVIPAIRSRCQMIRIPAPSVDDISSILSEVLEKEKGMDICKLFPGGIDGVEKFVNDNRRNLRACLLSLQHMVSTVAPTSASASSAAVASSSSLMTPTPRRMTPDDPTRYGSVDKVDGWLDDAAADALLAYCCKLPTRLYPFGLKQQRLMWAYGDPGAKHSFRDIEVKIEPWPSEIEAIRSRLMREFGVYTNFCLVNHYRDGRDAIAAHADGELYAKDQSVFTVSLGSTRIMRLVPFARDRSAIGMPVQHGDLVWMHGKIQQYWKHAIDTQPDVTTARYSFTFRCTQPCPLPPPAESKGGLREAIAPLWKECLDKIISDIGFQQVTSQVIVIRDTLLHVIGSGVPIDTIFRYMHRKLTDLANDGGSYSVSACCEISRLAADYQFKSVVGSVAHSHLLAFVVESMALYRNVSYKEFNGKSDPDALIPSTPYRFKK
jgi:DNA polymerase III delta prime subunit/alkylated DNA repair dioxygenase AlkB